MIYLIESFTKVRVYGIYLLSIVHLIQYILCEVHKVGSSATFRKETMLASGDLMLYLIEN